MEAMVDGHDERGHEKKRDRSTKHDLRALEVGLCKYVQAGESEQLGERNESWQRVLCGLRTSSRLASLFPCLLAGFALP